MEPAKTLFVPSVADEPTTQKTFFACAPLVSTTALADAVMSVEPAMMTNVDAALPPPFSVTVPVMKMDEGDAYAPGASVRPPMFCAAVSAVADGASAPSEARVAVSAACAATAAALPMSRVPYTPGGKPVTAVPGESATAPATTVAPVLVTVDAPRTLMPQSASGAVCASACARRRDKRATSDAARIPDIVLRGS